MENPKRSSGKASFPPSLSSDTSIPSVAAFRPPELDPRDVKTIPGLMNLLSDPNPVIRIEAAKALGLIRPAPEPALIQKSLDSPVKPELKPLSPANHLTASDIRPKFESIAPIGALHSILVPSFIARLDDPDLQVRLNAIEALARIGDERSIQALSDSAANGKDPEVRESAAKALSRLERP